MLPIVTRTAKKLPYLRRLVAARDGLQARVNELQAERDNLRAECARMAAERDNLRAEYTRAAGERDQFRRSCRFPAGHYYSPIPNLDEVRRRDKLIWAETPPAFPGIDLNAEGQLALVEELRPYYLEQPFRHEKQDHLRYWFDNVWFGSGDGIILHCLLRHLRPSRIIEAGSGFSSAVILDTNDLFGNGSMNCTFIEPEPDRLRALLSPQDQQKHRLLTTPLQDVSLSLFRELHPGDILFIDTSHVLKTGSEVNRVLFELLPALRKGVWIHIHDIHYPFEYPKTWVYEGWGWNETYAVRAFLQYNSAFKIRLFNSYLAAQFPERFRGDWPLFMRDPGGSLWLEKIAD